MPCPGGHGGHGGHVVMSHCSPQSCIHTMYLDLILQGSHINVLFKISYNYIHIPCFYSKILPSSGIR